MICFAVGLPFIWVLYRSKKNSAKSIIKKETILEGVIFSCSTRKLIRHGRIKLAELHADTSIYAPERIANIHEITKNPMEAPERNSIKNSAGEKLKDNLLPLIRTVITPMKKHNKFLMILRLTTS